MASKVVFNSIIYEIGRKFKISCKQSSQPTTFIKTNELKIRLSKGEIIKLTKG
jgi:hypothetical protein